MTYNEQRDDEAIDGEIAELEEKIGQLETEMMENATNSSRLSQLAAEKEQAEAELEAKMVRLVALNELSEKIAAQNQKG